MAAAKYKELVQCCRSKAFKRAVINAVSKIHKVLDTGYFLLAGYFSQEYSCSTHTDHSIVLLWNYVLAAAERLFTFCAAGTVRVAATAVSEFLCTDYSRPMQTLYLMYSGVHGDVVTDATGSDDNRKTDQHNYSIYVYWESILMDRGVYDVEESAVLAFLDVFAGIYSYDLQYASGELTPWSLFLCFLGIDFHFCLSALLRLLGICTVAALPYQDSHILTGSL
ncbi:hypothetical protein CBL_07409 [Carabus blaptoides fortunei]